MKGKLNKNFKTKNNHLVSFNSSGMISYERNLVVIEKGDVIFIPKNVTVYMSLYNDNNCVIISIFILAGSKSNNHFSDVLEFIKSRNEVEELSLKNKDYVLRSLEKNLISIISSNVKFNKKHSELINRIIFLITSDLRNKWVARDICEYLYISEISLYRSLKKYNTSIKKIVLDIRLEKAIKLIKQNELSIGEISFYVGFNSQSYFCKVFKRKVKCTPLEYKSYQ